MKKREIFNVEGDKIVRLRRNCPKCGDGVFLAEHKDRSSCGACGYTEFKGKKEKVPDGQPKPDEKPVDVPTDKPVTEPIPEDKAPEKTD